MIKTIGLLASTILLIWLSVFFYGLHSDRYQFDTITVDKGVSALELVSRLNERFDLNIRYSMFRFVQKVYGYQIVAGVYEFEEPVSLVDFARTLDQGDAIFYGKKLVIPEGLSNQKIADLIDGLNMDNLSAEKFLELASSHEGYLFPNTYYVDEHTEIQGLIDTMRAEFIKQTSEFVPPLDDDEVILASIIEREVAMANDRRMVSDILKRRMDLGMKLQVDATLNYYLDKDSAELTQSDLKEDHPFNTYVNSGLPPHPIANPGLDSLRSVRDPIQNKYLYYLSDNEGNIHYAVDLEGHVANRRQYLNQ